MTDPLFFATRFVEGLHSDIRAVVMPQTPLDLDSMCSLALLQEEVLLPTVRPEHLKGEFRTCPKSSPSSPLPLPLSSPQTATAQKTGFHEKNLDHSPSSVDGKLGALKAYRRACCLCDRCAKKWHGGHTCSMTIQLYTLQEVWDLLLATSMEDSPIEDWRHDGTIVMAISSEDFANSSDKRFMRFLGLMHKSEILILVDSGSTNSFIN